VFKTEQVSPAESEFCSTIYITAATFISNPTLIKSAKHITVLCPIVMHGIALLVQIDSVTVSLRKVFAFVPDFLSLAQLHHIQNPTATIRSCREIYPGFHGKTSYLQRVTAHTLCPSPLGPNLIQVSVTGTGHRAPDFQHRASFFLTGVLAKLQKATFSFVTSVSPSVLPSVCPCAWNNSAPTGRIFMKFYIYVFLKNRSRKFNSPLNLTIITLHYLTLH
jgi:hypothetical protein